MTCKMLQATTREQVRYLSLKPTKNVHPQCTQDAAREWASVCIAKAMHLWSNHFRASG